MSDLPAAVAVDACPPRKPRLRTAHRQQVSPARPLENLLDLDHQARLVWDGVVGLDRTPLEQLSRAGAGGPGALATDPRIRTGRGRYATLEGVGSARALAWWGVQHHACRWLTGGVSVNYHPLADFRSAHVEFLERLLPHAVAVRREQNLVALQRVAQDGLRVRARAGAAAFHRRRTLAACWAEAQEQVQRLKAALADAPAAPSRRQAAAQQRAAAARAERLRQALARIPALAANKQAAEKEQARVSSTDPEATVRKLAAGGYRPADHVPFRTTCAEQVLVGVPVLTVGSDLGQLAPLVEQLHECFGEYPAAILVEGGFSKHADMAVVEGKGAGCRVYAPGPAPKDPQQERSQPRAGASAVLIRWRERMGTAAAKALYKERAATAECGNAQARHRGLVRLLVRGLRRVKALALWYARAHHVLRGARLRAAAVAAG